MTAGMVACGHPDTAEAAREMLADGGNAYDAALAALCAAFFAEPVLASPGGGGFLLAAPVGRPPVVYDFFCETPARAPRTAGLDFHPVGADFGTMVQEFHIGRASVAVPGVVAGLFAAHRDLCRLPVTRLVEPALRLAREGVTLNAFQAEVFRIVAPIYRATPSARHQYRPASGEDRLPECGECLQMASLGDTLEALAREGEALFYRGEIARGIESWCLDGGLLARGDLERYTVERRAPLRCRFGDTSVFTNPLPSSGGILVSFGLSLLERLGHAPAAQPPWHDLARILAVTGQARTESGLDEPLHAEAGHLLDEDILSRYLETVRSRPSCPRGTTHISVIDADGNAASLSVSNGEGCGEVLGDTGIMLNNMLGEEDLNPRGFHRWAPASRITSMMAPTLLEQQDGSRTVLGSGGSNRIRTAILQVIVRLVHCRDALADAVEAPRIHLERDHLDLEPGLPPDIVRALAQEWPSHRLWDAPSLFFGGVHTVRFGPDGIEGAGDPRRSGVSIRCGET